MEEDDDYNDGELLYKVKDMSVRSTEI
jgi:hypothetical protein